MHVGVIFLSLNWLTIALFGLDLSVCSFKANPTPFCFILLLSVLHTSVESCQSYWENKSGVQADKNVLLFVVRHVNKVCVCVCVRGCVCVNGAGFFFSLSSFNVFYEDWRSQNAGIDLPAVFTFSPLICHFTQCLNL